MGLFSMMARDAIRTSDRNRRAKAKAKVPLTATQQLARIKTQESEHAARENWPDGLHVRQWQVGALTEIVNHGIGIRQRRVSLGGLLSFVHRHVGHDSDGAVELATVNDLQPDQVPA